MKKAFSIFITGVALLGAASLSVAEEKEKSVVFKTADGKYVTTATGSMLDLSGTKVGSKQVFTIIDANGGDLADGDDVKIRYNPGASAGGTPPKPNFWRSAKGELKRGGEGDSFKLKKVENKYVFQTTDGKFVAAPAGGTGALTLADSQDAALKVEIADAPATAPKTSSDKPAGDKKPAADNKPAETE